MPASPYSNELTDLLAADLLANLRPLVERTTRSWVSRYALPGDRANGEPGSDEQPGAISPVYDRASMLLSLLKEGKSPQEIRRFCFGDPDQITLETARDSILTWLKGCKPKSFEDRVNIAKLANAITESFGMTLTFDGVPCELSTSRADNQPKGRFNILSRKDGRGGGMLDQKAQLEGWVIAGQLSVERKLQALEPVRSM